MTTRARSFASLAIAPTFLLVGGASVVACSSSSSPSTSSSASTSTLALEGAYVPADGTSGGYRAVVFTDDTNYFLYISSCDAATDSTQCRRAGTYVATATRLSLTDSTSGASTTIPISAITTAPISASSTEEAAVVHLDSQLVSDAGAIVTDAGTLVCSTGALMHPTSLAVNGTAMKRVGGASDGTDATFCDPSHSIQDCADQGAAATDTTGTAANCPCTQRTGRAVPACTNADAGDGGRPSGGAGMQDGDGPSSGGCSGKTIMFDYQGSCDFLHRCDSYSKKLPEGEVEWGCLGRGDTCRDADFWISVPGHGLCGHSYKFCKGNLCVTARALDVSNAGVYEASQGVLDALGIPYGGGQTSCGGTYVGSSNGKITPAATLCSN